MVKPVIIMAYPRPQRHTDNQMARRRPDFPVRLKTSYQAGAERAVPLGAGIHYVLLVW